MKLSDLKFEYPEHLVATEPKSDSRVMFYSPSQGPHEITKSELLDKIPAGDLLVVNNTKVEKRRIFSGSTEVLFVENIEANKWLVLFPARGFKVGHKISLPGNVEATLLEKGLPQIIQVNRTLDHKYFEQFGEPALPPYIQKARGERHSQKEDQTWYQTAWAKQWGSVAAPTASLHFSNKDFEALQNRGVQIASLTLHVGLGTFLPVKTENLDEHQMHAEKVSIPFETLAAIMSTKKSGRKVWALGTTVCRALESEASGMFTESLDGGGVSGETRLFIRPGFEFKTVDVLMTNFHQPESTLLALVAGFAGLETVKSAYQWAFQKGFRLFSYGDLSVWTK